MTVALCLSDPHTFEGHPAYTVAVKEAATGHLCGSYVLVLLAAGGKEYILPSGSRLCGTTPINTVLRAVVQRPAKAAA